MTQYNDESMTAAKRVVEQLRDGSDGDAAKALIDLVNTGRRSPGSIARRAVDFILAESKRPVASKSAPGYKAVQPAEAKPACVHPWARVERMSFGALICCACDTVLVQPKIPEPPKKVSVAEKVIADIRAIATEEKWTAQATATAERVAKILLG